MKVFIFTAFIVGGFIGLMMTAPEYTREQYEHTVLVVAYIWVIFLAVMINKAGS